jgi:hypothetical protein
VVASRSFYYALTEKSPLGIMRGFPNRACGR